jgi:hypothetical protein
LDGRAPWAWLGGERNPTTERWIRSGNTITAPKRHGIFVPFIEDAERLQGFEAGWTGSAQSRGNSDRYGWRLVGNAVSVPVTGISRVWCPSVLAGEMMRADAALHPNQAWRQVGKSRLDLATSPLLSQDDRPAPIRAHELKRVLTDVDADDGDSGIEM